MDIKIIKRLEILMIYVMSRVIDFDMVESNGCNKDTHNANIKLTVPRFIRLLLRFIAY